MRPTDLEAGRFARTGGRNRFTARQAHVADVRRLGDDFVRVTVTGPDFADFPEPGPADHVRLFFPREDDGVLVAPRAVGAAEDGIIRPDEPVISRDFTSAGVRRSAAGVELDLDFLLHPDPGPAVRWAARAEEGDEIVVVGPRGSKHAPPGADGFVLIVDGTALPSAAQWIRAADERPTTVLVSDPASVAQAHVYFDAVGVTPTRIDQHDGTGADLVIGDGDFVFAAGEANSLIPIRAALRAQALPPAQFAVSGYWRRGVVAFDHHAPLDPAHPDD
ncbi:siderophore-interacting protein [Salinibacterium sp. ZJ77]|uniref:siderophore-interacting protein n=1 Tax=Salinibacterium sp. ZJ77 TaxID=2708337 RepID=UPI0014225D65|nr:siderophore-interacting protein [Salinibacterium sp. ZJ77]